MSRFKFSPDARAFLRALADIGVVLDERKVAVSAGEASLFECSIQAAAGLVRHFLEKGNRVGLLIYLKRDGSPRPDPRCGRAP